MKVEHHFIRNIVFILFLVSFVCGFAGWRLKSMGYLEMSKQTEEESGVVDFYGIKIILMDGDDIKDQYFDMLYLRSDGTYYLSIDSYYTNAPVTGTYKVDGNKISFHETARYSSDMCFYTNDLKDYPGVIGEGIITINRNGKNHEFAKGFGVRETVPNKNLYSAHPVDGEYPSGFASKWEDCTNK